MKHSHVEKVNFKIQNLIRKTQILRQMKYFFKQLNHQIKGKMRKGRFFSLLYLSAGVFSIYNSGLSGQ